MKDDDPDGHRSPGYWMMFFSAIVAAITALAWMGAHQQADDSIFADPVNNGAYQVVLGVCAVVFVAGAALHRKD